MCDYGKLSNIIGLDSKPAKHLADKLNKFQAEYQVFYMNARGFHWSIKGDKFFELHIKFEELYNDVLLKKDEVTERILTLGYTTMHTYTDYLKHSGIKAVKNISNGNKAVSLILDGFKEILRIERLILKL